MSVAPPPTPLPAPQARHPHGTGGTGGLSPGTKDHGASVGSRVTPTFLSQCREDASQVQLVSTLNCSTWPRCAGKQGQKSTCEWGGEAGIVLTCASLCFDRVSPLLCVFVVLPRSWRHTTRPGYLRLSCEIDVVPSTTANKQQQNTFTHHKTTDHQHRAAFNINPSATRSDTNTS